MIASRPGRLVGFGRFAAGEVGGDVVQSVFQLAGEGVVGLEELIDAALCSLTLPRNPSDLFPPSGPAGHLLFPGDPARNPSDELRST